MSRSYKKHPWYKDRSPYMKNQANRKVRRYKGENLNHKSYRKLFQSWDICDYKFDGYGKEEIKKRWRAKDPYLIKFYDDLKDAINGEKRTYRK